MRGRTVSGSGGSPTVLGAAAYHWALAGPAGGCVKTVPIATVALIISALVFAPLASYLAGRRARSAAMWFLLGVVLGPLAIVLLLFAPPGRCPDCGERVRGWPRQRNLRRA